LRGKHYLTRRGRLRLTLPAGRFPRDTGGPPPEVAIHGEEDSVTRFRRAASTRTSRPHRPAGSFATAAVVLLLLLPASAGAATVYVAPGGATAAPCGSTPATACGTIASAVASATDQPAGQPADVVQFAPGAYDTSATTIVLKRLTFRGAQADMPVSGRTPTDASTESILYDSTAPATSSFLTLRKSGIEVNGLVFSGRNPATGALVQPTYGMFVCGRDTGSGCNSGGTLGGYRITNNIFAANRTGMYLRDGRDSTIAGNLIADSVSNGIYSDDSGTNVTVSGNQFRGNPTSFVLTLANAADGTPIGSNITFSGNVSTDTNGASFRGINNLDVTDNTYQGGNGVAVSLIGSGNDNVLVDGNTITDKGRAGIYIHRAVDTGGQVENRDITIRENTITATRDANPLASEPGLAGRGIFIAANGSRGAVTIQRNRIVDNVTGGLRNEDDDATVNAPRNWWGCNLGPGQDGCDSVTSPDGSTNPDFTPWLTLSLAATPAELAAGAGNSLLARLANLSSGGLAGGPFFRQAPAAFDSQPAGGTYNPPTATLSTADLEATPAFTAGPRPTEWSVNVDNQTVRIRNTDPPAPDVIPDIVVPDNTLTPGQRVAVVVALANRGNRTARRLRACTRLAAKLNRSGSRCRRFARLRPGQTIAYQVLGRVAVNACRGRLAHRLTLRAAGQRLRRDRALGRLLAGLCGPPVPCPTAAHAARFARPGAAAAGRAVDRRRRLPHARAAC